MDIPHFSDSYPPSPDEELLLEDDGLLKLEDDPMQTACRPDQGFGNSSGSPNFDMLDAAQGRDSGSGPSSETPRPRDLKEKNKFAQRRYRAKKKEQLNATKRQMEELTTRLNELTVHNTELQRRQRMMSSVATMQEEHLKHMVANPVVRGVEADIILEELTRLISKVERRTVTPEEAKHWTIEQWVTVQFQHYIERLTALLPEARADPNSSAARELVELVTMRREAELRSSMFSSLYWAIWAWNVHNTAQTPANDPARTSNVYILEGLDLTPQQTKDILDARARLLFRLGDVAQQRSAALSALGLEMLHQPDKAALRQCQAGKDLHASLEEERDVVHTFLYRVTEEVLTPLQEAFLDTQLHPWFPDVWSLCNLLAHRHGLPPAPEFPELEQGPDDLMPAAPPYAILKKPVAAYGIGLRLKRTVLEWHFLSTHRVSPISGLVYELPRIKHLRGMTLYDAQMGLYRRHWKRDAHCCPETEWPENVVAQASSGGSRGVRASSPPAMSPCF